MSPPPPSRLTTACSRSSAAPVPNAALMRVTGDGVPSSRSLVSSIWRRLRMSPPARKWSPRWTKLNSSSPSVCATGGSGSPTSVLVAVKRMRAMPSQAPPSGQASKRARARSAPHCGSAPSILPSLSSSSPSLHVRMRSASVPLVTVASSPSRLSCCSLPASLSLSEVTCASSTSGVAPLSGVTLASCSGSIDGRGSPGSRVALSVRSPFDSSGSNVPSTARERFLSVACAQSDSRTGRGSLHSEPCRRLWRWKSIVSMRSDVASSPSSGTR